MTVTSVQQKISWLPAKFNNQPTTWSGKFILAKFKTQQKKRHKNFRLFLHHSYLKQELLAQILEILSLSSISSFQKRGKKWLGYIFKFSIKTFAIRSLKYVDNFLFSNNFELLLSFSKFLVLSQKSSLLSWVGVFFAFWCHTYRHPL